MIYSIGIDIVETSRIRRLLDVYGKKFLSRLYSADETESFSGLPQERVQMAAGLFAAKEAVMKSLGHFFDNGVFLRDIEILDRAGRDLEVRLPLRLRMKLDGKKIMVSISYQPTIAMAVAIITDEA